jgi:hypothetical protein
MISVYLDSKLFKKKISTICLKKQLIKYIHDTIHIFQIWHNLCAELTSILAIQKTTNEPTATYQIGQTTGEHLGHLKDLEISKYK